MTAPDPGLTDLIAAHAVDGISPDGNVFCHCKWVIVDGKHELSPDGWFGPAKDHPAHLALVVEQHTIGRIAALEAELEKQKRGGRTIGKAIDRTLKWVIEASNSEDLIGDDGDGDWAIVWDRLFQLRPNLEAAIDRAEKAEATIARVKDAVSGLPACDKYQPDDTISCGWKNAVVDVIAALEGEQQ